MTTLTTNNANLVMLKRDPVSVAVRADIMDPDVTYHAVQDAKIRNVE